jgi:hypothetical protein
MTTTAAAPLANSSSLGNLVVGNSNNLTGGGTSLTTGPSTTIGGRNQPNLLGNFRNNEQSMATALLAGGGLARSSSSAFCSPKSELLGAGAAFFSPIAQIDPQAAFRHPSLFNENCGGGGNATILGPPSAMKRPLSVSSLLEYLENF